MFAQTCLKFLYILSDLAIGEFEEVEVRVLFDRERIRIPRKLDVTTLSFYLSIFSNVYVYLLRCSTKNDPLSFVNFFLCLAKERDRTCYDTFNVLTIRLFFPLSYR